MFSEPDQEWNYASQQITILLQKVKMQLMSHELEQQKEAVAWLIGELNVNSTVRDILIVTLLKSEIISLLCETTMQMHGHLVTSTLKCLASLTISEQFYRQNHASYVIASMLRAGHFLTLESNLSKDQLTILQSIVHTLDKIFEGADNFRVSPDEICESIQVLKFIKKLSTAESHTYRIIFSVSKVLSFVLRYTRINDGYFDAESEDGELVFTVIEAELKLMRKILEAKNHTDEKYAFRAMVMTCAISATGISLCSSSNDSDTVRKIGSLKSSGNRNYRADIADCIYSAMMKAVIPNFSKIEQDGRHGLFYMWFVTCLNGLYEINYRKLKDLSNYLAGQGFLQILPRLTMLPIENLRNETLLLLSRILTTLAGVSLAIETWFGGAKEFQKFLINALKSLPPDPSTWLPLLSEGDSRSDALIVLFYYNFLIESTSTVTVYLPEIIAYISSSSSFGGRRKSTTILKALWLTFSIAAVSHEDPSTIDSYESGMSRLFNAIESADVIKQCYTHHPAVLIHCLKSTSAVSEKLRAGVICLWLENGGDIRCIVDAIVEGDPTNYYCLLEMVNTGSPRTVDIAMKAISGLIENPEAVKRLGTIVWEILQQILAPGYNRDGHNITGILKLAAVFEPHEIPGSLLVRLLYCLTNFILENKSDLNLVSLGIKTAYCLLSLSIRRNDIRGVAMFTNKPKLIEILKTIAFGNEDGGVSHICFNCLSTLIRCQGKYSVQCESPLEIESEELLQQLYREQDFGAIKLAADLFTSGIEKPLIALKNLFAGSDCDLTIRGIYLQIHIIHSRSGPEDRNFCYASLEGILYHCGATNNREVLKILCEMEWTHVLIEITLNGKQDMNSHFMDFLAQWLSHRFSVSPPCDNREFGRDEFETTLDLLGKAALTKFKEEPKDESLRRLVQSLVLFQAYCSRDIGADLEQADRQLSTS